MFQLSHPFENKKMAKSPVFTPQNVIMRKLPDSFAGCLTIKTPKVPIDVALARQQHQSYTELLRKLIPNVIELPADEAYPDCCFVEDNAIVVGNRAVITRMGAVQRRGEEAAVHKALLQAGITDFFSIHAPATLDGGDVLFTGRHFLVGLSKRTNENGVEQLRAIFAKEYPVYAVAVREALHLKSIMSAVDQETLVIAEKGRAMTEESLSALFKQEYYRLLFLPDQVAANVLSFGSTLVFQEGFPQSEALLRKLALEKGQELIKLTMSELIKADSALTCCSILF